MHLTISSRIKIQFSWICKYQKLSKTCLNVVNKVLIFHRKRSAFLQAFFSLFASFGGQSLLFNIYYCKVKPPLLGGSMGDRRVYGRAVKGLGSGPEGPGSSPKTTD